MTATYVSIADACEMIGCDRKKIYGMVRDGRLTAYKFGPRMTRLKKEEIERLAEQCKVATTTSGELDTTPKSGKLSKAEETVVAALHSQRLIERALK